MSQAADAKYRLDEGYLLEKGKRMVRPARNGVCFRCPCDQRIVFCTHKNHTIRLGYVYLSNHLRI